MRRLILALVVALPSPAAAVTWAFGGAVANLASVTATVAGEGSITAEARRFAGTTAPNALTNLSQLSALSSTNTALTVRRELPGIGITGGASAPQIDTNNASQREAMLLTSNRLLRLSGLKLSYIDNNDTLQIYGVRPDNTLVSLGFGGDIISGLAGAATYTNTTANNGTTVLTLRDTKLMAFSRYVFTTRVAGDVNYGGDLGQGYRIDSITAEVLPEPGSWLMLITGFGLTGAVLRRQRRRAAAALA